MNPRFDIATGRVMSGHYFSPESINKQPTPLVAKEKSHPHVSHVHHVINTKRHKKQK